MIEASQRYVKDSTSTQNKKLVYEGKNKSLAPMRQQYLVANKSRQAKSNTGLMAFNSNDNSNQNTLDYFHFGSG